MREIKFRAWVKHTTDNRWDWAYKKADEKATAIFHNGLDVLPGEEAEWRNEFLQQWDSEHRPDERLTVVHRMATDSEMGIYLNGKHLTVHGYEVLSVMQCTGLRDMNGNEIYDGDIVEDTDCTEEGVARDVVVWSEENGRWESNEWGIDGDEFDTVEVVGNIHENPELLK